MRRGRRETSARSRRAGPPERRRIRPAFDRLDGRALLAVSSSPSNPIPGPVEPVTQPTPAQLGAAYRQVLAIQAATWQGLDAAHQQLAAAFDHFAALANPSVPRDRLLLRLGSALTAAAARGLAIARGIANSDAYADTIDIPQHLFTTPGQLVQQYQTTGSSLVRSARRGTGSAIHALDLLAAQLSDGAER